MIAPDATRRRGGIMGERVILVCDVCGQPASRTVGIRVEQRSLVKDLCDRHVAELTAGTRRAKPGRRRGTVGTARKSAARAKRTTAKKTTAKRTTAPKNGRRRPRRPRKAATTESASS
jgi:hypothetical protein